MNLFECVLKSSSGGGSGADLVVTCDSVFAGTTITCTDGGSNTFTEVCPSTSPYTVTFESIPVGTYTVSGTYNGQTFSTTVTITDFTALLATIPDGSTVTPVNDIQTWLHCANIWDKNYSTIAAVLADTTTLLALISSNNAVDYMARSTSWASSVCANQTAMGYIGNNNYCADKLLSNSTWRTAICNSTYFESVLNVKVPTMTSNTTPSGVCSASSTYDSSGNYQAYKAFDGDSSSLWHSNTSTGTNWIRYMFAAPVTVYRIDISSPNHERLTNYVVRGSNDSSIWKDLTNATTPTSADFTIKASKNIDAYKYFEIYIPSSAGVNMYSLQFYGRA